jgi:hypothetical protein
MIFMRMDSQIHTYIRLHIHAYIHTSSWFSCGWTLRYIHTYIYTYMHTYIPHHDFHAGGLRIIRKYFNVFRPAQHNVCLHVKVPPSALCMYVCIFTSVYVRVWVYIIRKHPWHFQARSAQRLFGHRSVTFCPMYVCMHACMHVYIYIYICTHTHMYICTFIHTYMHTLPWKRPDFLDRAKN